MPDVDVVVAVHDERRAFVRAVRSALADGDPGTPRAGRVTGAARAGGSSRVEVRVSVVAHNLEADVVRARLEAEGLGGSLADGRVRVLELADGVPSPSGPFTLGLEQAEARYVSIMGSDDHLEPGALTAWFALGEARSSAAVLAPMRLDSGRLVRSPVPRPFAGRFWAAPLDPVRDRLAPRSAPLGLLRREMVERLGLRLVPGLRTGEDIPFSARLWFSGERLDLDRRAPAYVIGTDAHERVSTSPRPVPEELAAVRILRAAPWVEALGARERRALAVTMLRVHVLGAVTRRVVRGTWVLRGRVENPTVVPDEREADVATGPQDAVVGEPDRGRETEGAQDTVVGPDAVVGEVRWLGDLARDWVDLAPGALDPLSRVDRLVLDALLSGADAQGVLAAGQARAAAGRVATILPARWRHVADREGTLRRFVRERMWW